MHCDILDEYVDESACLRCDEDLNCEYHLAAIEKAADLDSLRNSKFSLEMKSRLAALLNLPDDKLNSLINNLFESVLSVTEKEIHNCILLLARAKAVEYVDAHAQKMLDDEFAKAIKEQVLCLEGDSKSLTTSIQEVIVKRIKEFFATKDKRGRDEIQETLNLAISVAVQDKVDKAIEELKEETIAKFNKEIMKKMMLGMANAIKHDKRLLAAIDD